MLRKISAIENRSPELLANARSKYSFQPKLTQELDSKMDDFDEVTLLKIVLWKTNRYPEMTPDILKMINDLRAVYSEEAAREVLSHLLDLKGFDLPMASTVLRFACPEELQIIDKRVYRLIMPENELKIPFSKEKKIEM